MHQAARTVLADAIGEYILIPRSGRSLGACHDCMRVQGAQLPLQNQVNTGISETLNPKPKSARNIRDASNCTGNPT